MPHPIVLSSSEIRVQVRPAEPQDAQGWLDLMRDVAAEGRFTAVERVDVSRRWLAREFRTHAWSYHRAAIAAVAGAEVVGQLTMYRDNGIHRHTAELGMSVAAKFRELGVGTALIDGAFDWCRRFEVEKAYLHVFPHNERAIRLYERMGFEREGLRKRQAKLSYGYEDLILMSRWVD